MMCECRVQIIEILDDSFYPGICRAVLEDYYNHKHFLLIRFLFWQVFMRRICHNCRLRDI